MNAVQFLTLALSLRLSTCLPVHSNDIFWENPCNLQPLYEDDEPTEPPTDEIRREYIRTIGSQYNVAYTALVHSHLEEFYQIVVSNFQEDHFVQLNWPRPIQIDTAPGSITTTTVFDLLPQFHEDIQKFCVGIGAIVNNTRDPKCHTDVQSIKASTRLLLCEIENVLADFHLPIPPTVQRDFMGKDNYELSDSTKRPIRDWNILRTYKNYLAKWRLIFDSYFAS